MPGLEKKPSFCSQEPVIPKVNEQKDVCAMTAAFWGKRLGRSMTGDEAKEIIRNVSGFFQILLEWDSKAVSANPTVSNKDRCNGDQRT